MAASVDEIKSWFEQGVKDGATHMIIVVDRYDHEDFPVYVMPNDDVHRMHEDWRQRDMHGIMEVYRISLGWEAQSKPYSRVMNF
jgi:hypothetical protein